MLIGIGHRKQSGKDLAAKIFILEQLRKVYWPEGNYNNHIEEFYDREKESITRLTGIEIKKFATNLKSVICALTGCHEHNLEDEAFKATNFPYPINGQTITYRQALQQVGTEVFRNWSPNIWIDSLFKDFTPKSKWIITDVRFKNEALKIRECGGVLLNIKRPHESKETHPSEVEMDNFEYDIVIENNSTVLDLIEKIKGTQWKKID